MTDKVEPVLAAIADLKAHVSSELARLDAKVGQIDIKVGQIDIKVGQIDAKVGQLDAKVGQLDAKVGQIDAKVDGLQGGMVELRERFDKQPDLRLLGHHMQAMIERLSALEEKNVRALAAINDFARENVTPGEVEALHSELKEVRELEFRHDVRLRRIEDELHLT
jgi:chromosome segregation ATPase